MPRGQARIAMPRRQARTIFALELVGLLGALALAAADGNGEEGAATPRESCVDASEIELLTEGMKLVYANQDEEAADWFRAKCWNGTVGQYAEMCTCFYWAFRAHTVSASCYHAPAVQTRKTSLPDRAFPATVPGGKRHGGGRGGARRRAENCGELSTGMLCLPCAVTCPFPGLR